MSRIFTCGYFDIHFKNLENFKFLNAFKIDKFYKFLKKLSKLPPEKVLLINTFKKKIPTFNFRFIRTFIPQKSAQFNALATIANALIRGIKVRIKC